MDPLLCFPADLPAEVTRRCRARGSGTTACAGPNEVAATEPDGRPTATRARWSSPATT